MWLRGKVRVLFSGKIRVWFRDKVRVRCKGKVRVWSGDKLMVGLGVGFRRAMRLVLGVKPLLDALLKVPLLTKLTQREH